MLCAVGACTVWGLSPLYFHLLAHVPPLEVLSHRTIWSVLTFCLILSIRRMWGDLMRLIADRRAMAWLALAALMVAVNWFSYIYAIQINHTSEASLGYYIYPVLAGALSYLVLGEVFGRLKVMAFVIATLAVGVLTSQLGMVPYLSLVIAVSFSIYALVKRQAQNGPIVTVMAETLILLLPALIWLWGVHTRGWHLFGSGGGVFGGNWHDTGMLLASGVITAVPLVLFSFAAKHLPYSTVGILFFVAPTLQFLCGVFGLGERVTLAHLIAFPMIWLAVAIFSVALIRGERQSRANARADTA